MVRIYLDMCALKRAYDEPVEERVLLEALAVASIVSAGEKGSIELASSTVLEIENSKNPFADRREDVADLLGRMSVVIRTDGSLYQRGREIATLGIRPLDALHLACAERGACDYFVTCDDRLWRAASRIARDLHVRVVNPLEVNLLEVKGRVEESEEP